MKVKIFNRTFDTDSFRELCEELETVLNKLTLVDNFGAAFRSVLIPAGGEVNIPHGLKRTPKYRIILRQDDANSLVTDGASPWTDSYITLKNQGASDTNITVMILRG